MILLQGPLPNLQTTTMLPNPQFNDSHTRQLKVDAKDAMNGELYTYVKSNTRAKLKYTWLLGRMKALELRAFITAYYRAKLRLTNHKGEIWEVYLTTSPTEFTGNSTAKGIPGDEKYEVTLEFEGNRTSAAFSEQC